MIEGRKRVVIENVKPEKAVDEVGYELNNRPDWVIIPLKGIKDLLEV